MTPPLTELRGAVDAAASAIRGRNGEPPAHARVERSRRGGQGDYSTNVAMLLAPALGEPPRDISERVGASLAGMLGDQLVGYEVAGPGFRN